MLDTSRTFYLRLSTLPSPHCTNEDEESSMASQYIDTFMDYAIEDIADILLEEVGGGLTQQLFEQMKRNYSIPTVDTTTEAAEAVAVKVEEVE